jgi:hypothetical protein
MKERPLPQPTDPLVEAFWKQCSERRLCFQRCTECGAWRHPPRVLCARCGSPRWNWERSSGRGRIFSWTVTHQELVRNFPEPVPYAVIVVELEEGVRMVSGLRGLPWQQLAIDLPVKVVFEDVGDGMKLPFFEPRRDGGSP